MRLTESELRTLGERFGVEPTPDETNVVLDGVNDYLADAETVDTIQRNDDTDERDETDREWWEPADDPLNAVACRCRIPATSGGPLSGMTVGLKDNVLVRGVPMIVGSNLFDGFVPRTDATVVTRLLDGGVAVTAKLTCDELAASGSGLTAASGPVKNPHDPSRTAGGSSGGSAAAVAAGLVDAALGTDTGGSIRIPASFCGVVGLKPTYGLVPQSGVVENTYSMDHVGPITSSVADAARVLDCIAGPDPGDPASLGAAGDQGYRSGGYAEAVDAGRQREEIRFGVLEQGFGEGVDDRVEELTCAAIDGFVDAGASVTDVSVEGFADGKAIKNVLSVSELAAHWRAAGAPYRRRGTVDPHYQRALAARFRKRADALGPHYKRKLLAGAALLENDDGRTYADACAARESYRIAFETVLDRVDVLVLPTMPGIAPRINAAGGSGLDRGRNTRPFDVTGQPAATVPNGTVEGMPVGLQLVGERFGEADLLAVADAVERTLATERGA